MGRNARFCKSLQVGDSINIKGRLQSREYQKRNIDGSVTAKIAYEISVSSVIKIEGDA